MFIPNDTGANISECGRYRSLLWRRWDPGLPSLGWIMLNPSTADAQRDDPTIRRCIAFAKREGMGAIVVGNLYTLRSSSPLALGPPEHAVGPGRDDRLREIGSTCELVVCAWGAHGLADFAGPSWIAERVPAEKLRCLGRTVSGAPRHPLYVKADHPLEEYS